MVIVTAYPVQITLNANTNFNSVVYKCSDSTCTSLSSLVASNSNQNPITYSVSGSGGQYFAEYDFTEDRCMVPHSYKFDMDDSTGAGPWPYSITFAKRPSCQSTINSMTSNSSIYDNQSLSVSVSLKSPINLNPNGPQIVPANLNYYYSTNSSVTVTIKNASQPTQTIASQTISSDIPWGTSKQLSLSFSNLPSGNYLVQTSSDVNDCMCSSSVQSIYATVPLTINSTNGTISSITIISPNNNTNYTSNIPLNFTINGTANLSQIVCQYSINSGANQSIPGCQNTTIPVTNLINGSNSLTIFASFNGANISNTVLFNFVNQSGNNSSNQNNTSITLNSNNSRSLTTKAANNKKYYNTSAVTINSHSESPTVTFGNDTTQLEIKENQKTYVYLGLTIVLLSLSIILAIILIYLLML